MAIHDDVKSISRSWRQHFGLQSATVIVLTATFSVVIFILSTALNFQRVLAVWGEQVQVSAYLEDDLDERGIAALKASIEQRPDVAGVDFISKEKAALTFRDQMASYAPDLMSDSEFATPFPASFQIRLKEVSNETAQVPALEKLAREIQKTDGVEDVSYGQSWVRNYSSFVGVMKSLGLLLGFILLVGSLFVVGNCVRTLVSGRKEEIEILELIGATSPNIRRPYIVEGILLASVSALFALGLNVVVYGWLIEVMKRSLAFARMAQEFSFLSPLQAGLVILTACAWGAVGAWLTVRSLNSGWAAARGIRA